VRGGVQGEEGSKKHDGFLFSTERKNAMETKNRRVFCRPTEQLRTTISRK
jgi:hypothetical protein